MCSKIRDKNEKFLGSFLNRLLVNHRNNRLSSKIINYCIEKLSWFTFCEKFDYMKKCEERLIAIRNYYDEYGKYPSASNKDK
jgi:hypothetical protein